jgi:hypothetical protein
MSRNNPNGYYPRIMPEELQQLSAANTKGSRGASARVQSQKSGKHKQGAAAASSSNRPVSRRVEYGGTASDPSALHADEYIEGRGSRLASFYFLNLGSDIIIDAGARGGLARFTNHSCAPNCHIEKWNVGGVVRIGIFANQRIERGRELTIDYQYDRVGNGHRQACFCGEPNCAKFIGAAKKELVDSSSSGNGRNKQKKAAEPTRLHLDDYDEVCCICGDGGELLMCDAKVCGSFCTRGYHAACVHLLPEEVPKRWICPYHQCDSCGSRQPRYFCHTCNESACEKCWQKSRAARPGEGEPETEVENLGAANAWAIFHSSRVRRDVPNYGRNVWTCCTTCQVDPMCMREQDRVQLYAQMAQGMARAIEERRADPEPGSDRGPSFGGEGVTPQELVTRMDNNEFTPRFDYFYWAISQGKRGTWSDGYVPPALRKQAAEAKEQAEEEESDDAWIERKYREAHPDVEDDDEEDGEDAEEEEHKESDVDGVPATFPAAAAASAAAPSPAAAVAAEPVPMDMDEDEDESSSASPASAAAASTVAPSARQPREKLEPRKHLSYKTSRDRDAAARAFAAASAAAVKRAARNGAHTAAASKPSRGQKRRAADAIEPESEQDEAVVEVEDNNSARRMNKRGRRAPVVPNGHHASIASISAAAVAAASSAAAVSAATAAPPAASGTKRRGRPPASKHQQQPPAHNNLALTPLTSSRHASSRALAAAAAAAASSSGLTVTVSKRKRGHCSIAPAAPLTDTESSESNSDESDLVDTRADAAAAAAASQSSNNGKRPRRASSVRGQLAQLTEQQQLERALAESSAAAVAAVQAKTNAALAAARAAEAAGASSSSSSSSAAKSVATRGAAAATATNGTTTQKFASGLRSVLGKFFSPPSASTRKEKGSA